MKQGGVHIMTYQSRRRSVRYQPETNSYARVTELDKDQSLEHMSLVLNESYRGCCLIMLRVSHLKEGQRLMVEIPPMNPIQSEVVWNIKIDEDISRIGLKYLE